MESREETMWLAILLSGDDLDETYIPMDDETDKANLLDVDFTEEK